MIVIIVCKDGDEIRFRCDYSREEAWLDELNDSRCHWVIIGNTIIRKEDIEHIEWREDVNVE